MFDLDDDMKTLLIVGGLVYIGTRVARAVKTIQQTVERANNYGLTDDEDRKAAAALAAKSSTLPEKQAAVATLQRKIANARAVLPADQYRRAVKPAEKALELMAKALRDEEELAKARAEWEKWHAANVIPITPSSTPLDESARVADPERKKKGPATK